MKKYFLLTLFVFTLTTLFAQITISREDHAFLAGDLNETREINYISPGNAGPDQIWDFTSILFTNATTSGQIGASPSKILNDIGDFNLILSESGYEYYYNSSESMLEEKGYITKDISLVYSDPVVKMKYPLSYGTQFTDHWAGNAIFRENFNISLSGDFTVSADAFGTLILPDRTLRDVLRVKSEKNGIETNVCSSTESNIVRYAFYAPGYRYPVLIINTRKTSTSGQEPVITNTAAVNLTQPYSPNVPTALNDPQTEPDNSLVSVIVYPNPFNEKLSYNYFLRERATVSVDLYDISGRYSRRLIKTKIHDEGLHTGELNATDLSLKPGVYYLRFTFDNKVVISKIVKI
jgi:hypothetical protein